MIKTAAIFLASTLLLGGCASVMTSTGGSPDPGVALTGADYTGAVPPAIQEEAAEGVIRRLLGSEAAGLFRVEVVTADTDYFEVSPSGGKILLRGSDGVSALRGLKWYLNEVCDASISWRGDNLPDHYPMDFAGRREETPYPYRYIFNNCIFGYSTPWWSWEDWERLLDVLAFNGINMPAMLLGQEKVWQEVYTDLGYSTEDLGDFFAGPAWYPWQWMGNLNGWGGPLPQSVIERTAEMQKRILARARSLGMTPVLPGFSGHIPAVVVERNPGLKHGTMEWWGFGPTHILDWEEPLFHEISVRFIEKQRDIYGTDHYYNIDPFNEMTPPRSDTEYLANMSRAIFASMDQADPEGTWVLMTWFAKNFLPDDFWTSERTRAFLDSVPDDRLLALELWGENWTGTGWYKHEGWYGKPWVWSILQNFGDRVDIYGGLPQIMDNFQRMEADPGRGDLQGMGIMTEGLGYNPIVYELVLDMMWGEGVAGLEEWKRDYIRKRYGSTPGALVEAWDILHQTRYRYTDLVNLSVLVRDPVLTRSFEMDPRLADAWRLMLAPGEELRGNSAYEFDLVNVAREAMGELAPYFIVRVRQAVDAGDLAQFQEARAEMITFMQDFDALMGTQEAFLLGKWLADARGWGSTPEEKAQMEWGAKRQITDWGGNIGGYAQKEWSGIVGDRTLPAWEIVLDALEADLAAGWEPDIPAAMRAPEEFLEQWPHRHSYLPSEPQGDPVTVARKMYRKYLPVFERYAEVSGEADLRVHENVPGSAVAKPVTYSGHEPGHPGELAVNGDPRGNYWGAVAPAWLVVDLLQPTEIAAFHVFPYRGDDRYYQYTIELSVDGENWMPVVDMSANTEPSTRRGHFHQFNAGYAVRHVRINMTHNSSNPSVHLHEFKVLTPADMQEIEQLTD